MNIINVTYGYGHCQDCPNGIENSNDEVNMHFELHLMITRNDMFMAINNDNIILYDTFWFEMLSHIKNILDNINSSTNGSGYWDSKFEPSIKDLLEDNNLSGIFQNYAKIKSIEYVSARIESFDDAMIRLLVMGEVKTTREE